MPFVLRVSALALCMVCTAGFATQSSELLDTFNQLSLNGPSASFDAWDGLDGANSEAFKSYYGEQVRIYRDSGTAITERAIACSSGEIDQSAAYASIYDLTELSLQSHDLLKRIDNQLLLWQSFDGQEARAELDTLVASISVIYAKTLFELSSCSGYLSGELVN